MPSNRNRMEFSRLKAEISSTCPTEAEQIVAEMMALREKEGLGNDGIKAAMGHGRERMTECSKADVSDD